MACKRLSTLSAPTPDNDGSDFYLAVSGCRWKLLGLLDLFTAVYSLTTTWMVEPVALTAADRSTTAFALVVVVLTTSR